MFDRTGSAWFRFWRLLLRRFWAESRVETGDRARKKLLSLIAGQSAGPLPTRIRMFRSRDVPVLQHSAGRRAGETFASLSAHVRANARRGLGDILPDAPCLSTCRSQPAVSIAQRPALADCSLAEIGRSWEPDWFSILFRFQITNFFSSGVFSCL